MENITNNLFNYATSELSQDAFICYLASFAIKGNNKNEELYKCAIEFINFMLPEHDKMEYGEFLDIEKPIRKQYKCIDVLICAKGYHIIVEDKTYTNMHGKQISRYEECLIEEKVSPDKIRKIYYKIIEQPYPEDGVDYEFTRSKILELLKKYVNKCCDKIIIDYYNYLDSIDKSINMYKSVPIEKWKEDWRCYIGFFNDLQKNKTISYVGNAPGWGYVPNQKGGFMGFWWTPVTIDKVYEQYKTEFYLQIENNYIVLKIANEEVDDVIEDKRKNDLKPSIINAIKDASYEVEFSKKISINSRTVSICNIKYDESNYKEKICLMQDLLLYLKNIYDKDCKGIMFDTNQSYYKDDENEMLMQSKVWAKGNPKRYVNSFNVGDYVLYYSKGNGIIAIGKIIDEKIEEISDDGLARKVDVLVPEKKFISNIDERECLYPSEIKSLLNKNFYFASTIKSPYLNEKEVKILKDALEKKYNEK